MKNRPSDPAYLQGKRASGFILLCGIVYMCSYITRINYGAVIADLIPTLGITKSAAGLVSTTAFFTYGAGQIVSGILGDRFDARRQVAIGILGTVLCNLGMMLLSDIRAMTVIWGINGIFQAMFWPPMARLMTEHLHPADYANGCVMVTSGGSIGTILVYLMTPLLLWCASWRAVFFCSAVIGLLTCFVWMITTRNLLPRTGVPIQKITADAPLQSRLPFTRTAIVLLSVVCAAIVMQGILRDGVTTWMPTFLSEKFGLSASLSVLSGVLLPIFSIVSCMIATALERKLQNEVLCGTLFFGICTLSSVCLRLLDIRGDSMTAVLASVLLLALMNGAIHGANMMLTSRFSPHFRKFGRIATVSGIVNASTYIGSALSVYGFAAVSDARGWSAVVSLWFLIGGIGTLLCAVCIRTWMQFKNDNSSAVSVIHK